ncbi:MAG: hypothetical protein RBG13Loki_3941 [Promethearchaeota archaeon CR_4]|nr:MAG: hypothetical protein RBG13Loki_3941 [Candidatus Lokiarchaeota archaeon CR_4]
MKKRILSIVMLSCLITAVGASLATQPAAAAASTWGVAPNDVIELEMSIELTADLPAGVDDLLDAYLPGGYDISSILTMLKAEYDIKITVLSINDISCLGGPLGGGEVINVTIEGRVHGTSSYSSVGTILADYVGKVIDVMNLFYGIISSGEISPEEKGWILGNITAMSYTNMPFSCWVTTDVFADELGIILPSDFPLDTLPMPMVGPGSMMIIPTTVNIKTLYNYAGSMWSTYMPSYFGTLDEILNAYGSYVTPGDRDIRFGWSLEGLQEYLKDIYGYDYIGQYTKDAKFDVGAYYGVDTSGVLSASCLYMDASATMDLDFTAYGGPDLSGAYTFSASVIIHQKGVTVPTKESLYVKKGIPGYSVGLIILAALASVTMVLIRFKRRK